MGQDDGYKPARHRPITKAGILGTPTRAVPVTFCQPCKTQDCDKCTGEFKQKYGIRGVCQCTHRKLKRQQDAENRLASRLTPTSIL